MTRSLGAYGFRFCGIEGPLLDEFPDSWPAVNVRQVLQTAGPVALSIDDSRAEVPLFNGGNVEVLRDPPAGTYYLSSLIPPDELAHPYLVPVAAVHALWNGYETLHAGGFVVNNRAWAVLASRRGGKSSLLAALSVAGFDIVSDDLIVTDSERVFAGPRSIDLRPDAVPHFPVTRSLGVAGRRPRWRVDPGSVPPEIPLGGWLTLHWGEEFKARRIEIGERIKLLAESRTLKGPNPDPGLMLRLAAKPMWAITRPRGWGQMGKVLDLILETVS